MESLLNKPITIDPLLKERLSIAENLSIDTSKLEGKSVFRAIKKDSVRLRDG